MHIWLIFDELYTKIATYVKFRFQFAIQFLAFAFVVSGTNNSSTHLKQGPLCSLIFNLWTVVYFLDIKNTSFCWRFWSEGRLDFQIIVEFLAGQEHFPSSYVNSKLVTMMLLLSPRDCFSIGSSCVQYKRICVQRPSLRCDSGWMICWQKIDNINSTFRMIIHYMYVRFLLSIIGDLDIVMHSCNDDDILLTPLLLVNVWHKHYIFLLVVDIKGWHFFSIVDGFQLFWYSLSIMPQSWTFSQNPILPKTRK